MKNLILTAALILAFGTTFGQMLKKGNLIGVHHITVNLDPDVTMNQFKDFYVNKLIPEYEKHIDGKLYLLNGIRGENANSLGLIWVFDSEENRNKYFNEDGNTSDFGTTQFAKLESINEELAKLGTWTSKYTDWIVQ